MRKGEATRQVVLDAATSMASLTGLRGVTIGTLADRTDLSKSGLFAHFGSKEELQLQILDHARARFVDTVLRPALAAPRGEPRVRALFDGWMHWDTDVLPGGCVFIAAAFEVDDEPGVLREAVRQNQRDLSDTIAQVFSSGIAEGQFRPDADPEQFAFDLKGIFISYHHHSRLLGDPDALARARRALDALLDAARA